MVHNILEIEILGPIFDWINERNDPAGSRDINGIIAVFILLLDSWSIAETVNVDVQGGIKTQPNSDLVFLSVHNLIWYSLKSSALRNSCVQQNWIPR